MLNVAHYLGSAHRIKSGFLNPADVVALRTGFMGMDWDDGPVAFEQIVAMETTLLLQYIGANPEAWQRDRIDIVTPPEELNNAD